MIVIIVVSAMALRKVDVFMCHLRDVGRDFATLILLIFVTSRESGYLSSLVTWYQ